MSKQESDSMTEYTIHPKCSDVREMTQAEYARLLESMKGGYDPAYPIILHEGMILDGRHRYRACRELGIEPVTYDWVPQGDDSPWRVVLRSLARRHLTKSEQAAYAVEALPEEERLAAERQKRGKSDPMAILPQGTARKVVAKAAGVSERYVQDAKKLQTESPTEFAKVKAGEKSLSEAKKDAAKPVSKGPPSQVKDELSRPVTEKLVIDSLAKLDWFEDVARRLHAIKREILEVADTGPGAKLRKQSIETDFKNIVEAVRWARPYTTCPYKGCETNGCDTCKGTRWVTQEEWKRIPVEIRGDD